MWKEELFRLLTMRYNIPFQQEEVQKAVQDIHRVLITTHLQAADLPVLNQEVPILQGHLRGHPRGHPRGHLQDHLQVLHHAEDSL